jgi:tetratricopeptide (TPR) repeat protein
LPKGQAAKELHAQGASLFKAGRFAEAIPVLNRAAELEPGSASIHHLLGAAYFYEGQMGASEAALRRAIAANPTHPQTHASMGYTLYALGRFEEAGRAFGWVSAEKGWKDLAVLQALALLRAGGAPADEGRRLAASWAAAVPAARSEGGGKPSANVDGPRRTLGRYLLGDATPEEVAAEAWPNAHWRALAEFVVAAGAIPRREDARAKGALQAFIGVPAPDNWILTLQWLATSELNRTR